MSTSHDDERPPRDPETAVPAPGDGGGTPADGGGPESAARGCLLGDWSDDRSLAELLADAAATTTADVDLEANRTRIVALMDRHRLLARTVLFMGVVGAASVWLIAPLVPRIAGGSLADGGADVRLEVTAIYLVMTGGFVGWTWWANRRLERAMASGPPALRRATHELDREVRLFDRLVVVSGVVATPGLLLVAWEQLRSGGTWWFTLMLLVMVIWVSGSAFARMPRLIREDGERRRRRRRDGEGGR